MPLEATMVVIDNSEYMRNGDYVPTRFDAQADAVSAAVQAKLDANAENTVGLLTCAGTGCARDPRARRPYVTSDTHSSAEVLVTHTKELGQILSAVHGARAKLGGAADLSTALAVAQLALKHRQNKMLRQRVLLFAGSPLPAGADERALARLARRLKKNNVAVDVVAFGDALEDAPRAALAAFVEAVNSSDNSCASAPSSSSLLT
jgi:26S proteasome regulatory subunit N10